MRKKVYIVRIRSRSDISYAVDRLRSVGMWKMAGSDLADFYEGERYLAASNEDRIQLFKGDLDRYRGVYDFEELNLKKIRSLSLE